MACCDWNEEFDFTGICGGAGEGLEALELGVTMSWPVRVLVRVQLVSAATTKAAASSMLEANACHDHICAEVPNPSCLL